MKIETCVNVPDNILFENILHNSKRPLSWVKSVAAHDGHAVMVGGGPSSTDWIEEIHWRQSIGQTIFALNGAAKWLYEQGITADYQVVLDARVQNKWFIGYAKKYLLASQCHPILFDRVPPSDTKLWHQDYPDNMEQFDAALPADCPAHALIGGGTTVGLSGLALVYALGYRQLHLYGYDSSFRNGESHAYTQIDNQAIPCVNTVEGREFHTTLSMAQQAELFPQLSDMLIDAGCVITIRGDGLLPWISQMSARPNVPMTEQEKYQKMWEFESYRVHAPGEEVASRFLELAKPKSTDCVYDIGCGTGRGAKRIGWNAEVTMFDIADNCLDEEVRRCLDDRFRFRHHDISSGPIEPKAEFAYCTDMMEHVPPADIDQVLSNIISSAKKSFFQISLVHDNFGTLIGHHLHLSVHPFEWWKENLEAFGNIEYFENNGHTAIFYLSTT